MQLPVISSFDRKNVDSATFSSGLVDNFNRPITYLRLAVTDRCNLRCAYCMPENMRFLPTKELLTNDEIIRLVGICAAQGIRKVRVTGGEPFVRRGIIDLLWRIKEISGIEEVHITTNGVLTEPHIPELQQMGIASVNLSMDTFDAERFRDLTRRDEFAAVHATFEALIASAIPLSVNAVIMENKNIDDVIAMSKQTQSKHFTMRFIEEMPFNGGTHELPTLLWTHDKILATLKATFPTMTALGKADNAATADLYQIPGYAGKIGIIAGFSRTFCGACNRIRITAKGTLKTCLYDNGVLNFKTMMRSGASDEDLSEALIRAVMNRFRDGFEAERHTHATVGFDSMSEIGG
ncbi:MAG: GTP 3',8-cyclase MoaA [Candidatus Kapaibacteriota bacterium]|jgi:molybdenum cofactor biosynthesis protein A